MVVSFAPATAAAYCRLPPNVISICPTYRRDLWCQFIAATQPWLNRHWCRQVLLLTRLLLCTTTHILLLPLIPTTLLHCHRHNIPIIDIAYARYKPRRVWDPGIQDTHRGRGLSRTGVLTVLIASWIGIHQCNAVSTTIGIVSRVSLPLQSRVAFSFELAQQCTPSLVQCSDSSTAT